MKLWPEQQRFIVSILTKYLSKDYQTMKFGQLVECSLRKFFLKNHTENFTGKLAPRLTLFLKKLCTRQKHKWSEP